jgi:hypothetical protein
MSVFSSLLKLIESNPHPVSQVPPDKLQLDEAKKRLLKNKSDLNKASDELSAMINRLKKPRERKGRHS